MNTKTIKNESLVSITARLTDMKAREGALQSEIQRLRRDLESATSGAKAATEFDAQQTFMLKAERLRFEIGKREKEISALAGSMRSVELQLENAKNLRKIIQREVEQAAWQIKSYERKIADAEGQLRVLQSSRARLDQKIAQGQIDLAALDGQEV